MAKTPFLAYLHSRFGLSRSQVVEVAARAAGRDVEDIERLARGYDNEVYRVRLAGELVVYVRIRRHGEGTLEQEAWRGGTRWRSPVPDVWRSILRAVPPTAIPSWWSPPHPGSSCRKRWQQPQVRNGMSCCQASGRCWLDCTRSTCLGCGVQVTTDSGPIPTRCVEVSLPSGAANMTSSWRPA